MCRTCEMTERLDYLMAEELTMDRYKWFAIELAMYGETYEEMASRLLIESAPDAVLSIVDVAMNATDPELRKEAQEYLSNIIRRRKEQ